MWTKEARIQHVPRKERYPSDMTDMEWAIIAPLIPPQRPGGRHRETDMRGGYECRALRAAYGMPVAAVAEGFSTALHRLQLFLGMDALRCARPYPPHTACEGARDGGPRGKPNRCNHRYEGCESD